MKFGDLYYKKLSLEKTVSYSKIWQDDPKKILKSQREIEMFAEDNANRKLPLDGPPWRIYGQHYLKPEDGKTYLLIIYVIHHSLMDGASSMAVLAAQDLKEKYNPNDLFLKVNPVPYWNQILLKLMVPFSLFKLLFDALTLSRDANKLT